MRPRECLVTALEQTFDDRSVVIVTQSGPPVGLASAQEGLYAMATGTVHPSSDMAHRPAATGPEGTLAQEHWEHTTMSTTTDPPGPAAQERPQSAIYQWDATALITCARFQVDGRLV